MSITPQARQLTESHRLAQVKIAAQTVQAVLRTWKLVDPTRLDESSAEWLDVALRVVQSQHQASARTAAAYLKLHRTFELGALGASLTDIADFRPVLAVPNTEQITTSLRVMGPVLFKSLRTGNLNGVDQAMKQAGAGAASAALRLALGGSRDTISESIATDPQAAGFQRVGSGNPCSFCLMLISRGPVYRSEDSGSFEAHDACACMAEPVYSRDTPWTPQALAAREKWDIATDGANGPAESLNAFRRYLAGEPASDDAE